MQILVLGVLMFIVPILAGGLFHKTEKGFGRLLFMWISGQVTLWAGFQCICVPLILLQRTLSDVKWIFLGGMGVLAIAGCVILFVAGNKAQNRWKVLKTDTQVSGRQAALWSVFFAVLAVQLILTGILAYEEGDDAFYVAISTITVDAETMYSKLPYTGGTTGLDARHGLAPFPIWISVLSVLSGVPAVTLAHIAIPIVLIMMAYAIYYVIGCHLLEKRRKYLPYFMILTEIMILFGGYSVYSAENFLLVRTSQGKAVLANIIIPFLLLLFMILLERIQRKERTLKVWLLIALSMVTACLCSTLGALLVCILLGIVGLCILVCYRKWSVLLGMVVCCMVPVGVAVLYFMLG